MYLHLKMSWQAMNSRGVYGILDNKSFQKAAWQYPNELVADFDGKMTIAYQEDHPFTVRRKATPDVVHHASIGFVQ
jgi:hypothetical protein